MSLLRLLSAYTFASVCVMSAAAQRPVPPLLSAPAPGFPLSSPQETLPKTFTFVAPSPALPKSFAFAAPPLFKTSPPRTTEQTPPASPSDEMKAKAGLAAMEKTLAANNEGCYTMRSYGFTAGDLHSSPRPSTSTTCTPAHTVTLKNATASAFK